MTKRRPKSIRVVHGRGNVFADLGLARPEDELTKAKLASAIRQAIRRRALSQVRAASRMGIAAPKLTALLNGRLGDFSSTHLLRLLAALRDQDEKGARAERFHR